MSLDFFDRCVLDQRSLGHTFGKTIAYIQLGDFGCKFFDKRIVNAVLNIDAVGAHTGLPRVTKFADHGALDGRVNVGVVKHNKGRVAAQFQGEFLHCGR